MTDLLDRFFKYVAVDTQADDDTGLTPSTPGQMIFAKMLVEELEDIGLAEVELDENGYVMATLPATTDKMCPVIGFISHMDTSPDFSGKHVSPRVFKNYDGGALVLDEQGEVVLNPIEFPELKKYLGQDIITASGNTLLGADDKAGLAEIVTAMAYLVAHPEIEHGKLRVCFTPDEEIGAGADHFNVQKFGADFAYTMDGGEIGELEYENFNAAMAKVSVKGRNVHPGYAKGKMRNSMVIANKFMSMLPEFEKPETTSDYEGFYHLISFNGEVEKTEMQFIIRDFESEGFEHRKREMLFLAKKINEQFDDEVVTVELKDQYYNMKEKVVPVMHIVDMAQKAMEEVGVKPLVRPIRGGTDGARLSFMGLPTPNIFAGGHNFHGRYEFVPLQSMEKAVEVILKIVQLNVG